MEDYFTNTVEWLNRAQRIAGIGIWNQDIAKDTLWWSDETYRIFEMKPQSEKMNFDKFLKMVHHNHKEIVVSETQRLLETHENPYKAEYKIITKTGNIKILYEEASIEFDSDNKPKRIIGIIKDITQQRENEAELIADKEKAEERELIIKNQNDELQTINEELLSSNEELRFSKDQIAKSEEKFRTVADYTYDWEYWIDTKGKLIYISPSCKNITGYTRDDFLNNSDLLKSIIHPDDTNIFEYYTHNIFDTGEIKPIDFRIITKEKKIRWVSHVCQTIYDNSGAITGQRGSNRDITERKKTEQALNESESRFRRISQNMPIMMDAFDDKGNIIFWNNECEKVTGFSAEQVINNPKVSELLYPDKKYRAYIFEMLKKHKSSFRSLEWDITCKDGTRKTILWSNISKESPVAGWYSWAVGTDITERKKAEQALIKSEEKFRALAETMQDVIIRISKTGKLLYVSPSIKQFAGYNPEEEIGNNISKYFAKKTDLIRALKLIADVVITKKIGSFEFMMKPKNKVAFPIEHTYVPLIKNSKVYAIQMVLRDITERKKAEQALKESEANLRESNATKDKFFSIISHDLRSPFNSMLGFSKMLDEKFDKYDTEKKKKFINIIYQGLQNTFKLLENLLTWSRTQRGIIDFKPETINLYLVAEEISGLLYQLAENKSIKLINKISENISIKVDRDMFSTIIRNLISNAIKFTPKGGKILIDAKNKQQFIEITVKDNGIGISKEIQSKLFDIGENTTTQGTENEAGTGLGLILCKEFVEKHGGEIWIESEIEKGSSFIFTIPYKFEKTNKNLYL